LIRDQIIKEKIKNGILDGFSRISLDDIQEKGNINWNNIFKDSSPALVDIVNSVLKAADDDDKIKISIDKEKLDNFKGTDYVFNRPDIDPMGITGENSLIKSSKKSKNNKTIINKIKNNNRYISSELTIKLKSNILEKYKNFTNSDWQKKVLKEIREKIPRGKNKLDRKNKVIRAILRDMR
jgi:hypothetical protein